MSQFIHLFEALFQQFSKDLKDQIAMQSLAPLYDSYLPWSTSAMRPSGIKKIINEIILNDRRSVVECGGGVSTLFTAQTLSQYGGHLYTIEHDEAWSVLLKKMIAQRDLNDYVSIITAPLIASSLSPENLAWYDTTKIEKELLGISIDMLVVDGPLAYTKELRYARYPAVPYFSSYFAKDYSIALDDIDRVGEKRILQQWAKLTGIKFESSTIDGGIAIGRTNKLFQV